VTPLISVITASKNYARFLPQALGSALAQTFSNWELIVIDDGSTDDTAAVIQPFLADERIRYVKSDRLGQSRAKNLGLALSRGEFVAFLDADDVWVPTKLERQMPLFDDPDVGVVFSRRSLIDEAGQPLPLRSEPPFPRGRVLNDLFVRNFVCFSSAVVRRSVFERVGRFDESLDLAIDYDLWLRVAKHFAFDFVDEPLVKYRTGHGNLSKRLSDRVATACSIMTRAVRRGGLASRTFAEGFASTCRTLGYVLRRSEPGESLRWYATALRWPQGRYESLKGLVAATLALGRARVPGPAENAIINR
jgi:glycosyltransferase involved in cell wall biosynthesis